MKFVISSFLVLFISMPAFAYDSIVQTGDVVEPGAFQAALVAPRQARATGRRDRPAVSSVLPASAGWRPASTASSATR